MLSGTMSMKREVCTKVSFNYTCILIPITKILNLLLLRHAQVGKISCINSVSIPIKSIITHFITETSPYSFGNFLKLSLYNCFMPI